MSLFHPIVALLQFTTILPLGKIAPFESFAKATWLYPLAGYVTGGIAALILLVLPLPPLVNAVIGVGVIFLLTGCNHLDGLLDLGDGLMAHGGKDVRIRALTDRMVGTGGIALGMIITLLSVSSLAYAPLAAVSLMIAEVGGKYAMTMMTIFGKPFHPGLHATLHAQTKKWFIIPASFLLLPIVFLPLSGVGFVSVLLVMIFVPLFLIWVSYRLFGGVNGDVTGASGEITRAIILTVVAGTGSCCSPLSGIIPLPGLF